MTARGSRRRFFASLAPGTAAAGLVEKQEYWFRLHRLAMACRFEITLADRDGAFAPAARAALEEIDRLEAELSVFRQDSFISNVKPSRRARAGSPPSTHPRSAHAMPVVAPGDRRRLRHHHDATQPLLGIPAA